MPTPDDIDEPTARVTPTLILVPTAGEARVIEDERRARGGPEVSALCGFGPIAAAASTARQLAHLRPRRVLLLGIAGTFDTAHLPIGVASPFARVTVDGIGAGEGRGMLGPRELGLPQWRADKGSTPVHDTLPLSLPTGMSAPSLLTVCSCSASPAQAARRREGFDGPAAEDMEGFGVALACLQFNVPLCIVRGISNEVGDRDVENWAVAPALRAAWDAACAILDAPDWCVHP